VYRDRRTTSPSVCRHDDNRLDVCLRAARLRSPLCRTSFRRLFDVLSDPAWRHRGGSRPSVHGERAQSVPALVSDRQSGDRDLRFKNPVRRHPIRLACVCGDGDVEIRIRAEAISRRLFDSAHVASDGCHATTDSDRPKRSVVGRRAVCLRPGTRARPHPEVHPRETGKPRHHERVRRQIHFRVRTTAVSLDRCRLTYQSAPAIRAGASPAGGLTCACRRSDVPESFGSQKKRGVRRRARAAAAER
jgi:hypothetical protein